MKIDIETLLMSHIPDKSVDMILANLPYGTTIACKNTGRRFIGIELDEKYFNITKDRIENIK